MDLKNETWKEIKDDKDIEYFMHRVAYFHDSCLKELKYISGAYIEENFMHPTNEKRNLRIIIQCGAEDIDAVEMEFTGLKKLQLIPLTEIYTCEILEAKLLFINGDICWCDWDDWEIADSPEYKGIMVCASRMRWRVIKEKLGNQEFYCAIG